MKKYKFYDKEETMVTDTETGTKGINSSMWLWAHYQAWLKEGNVTEPFQTKEERKDAAAKDKFREFEAALEASFKGKFRHTINGGIEHKYYCDKETEDYIIKISTMIYILNLPNTDAVPTEYGTWKTADFEADGITPIYVPMTVRNFKYYCIDFFNKQKKIFARKDEAILTINKKIADPVATVEDIHNIVINI